MNDQCYTLQTQVMIARLFYLSSHIEVNKETKKIKEIKNVRNTSFKIHTRTDGEEKNFKIDLRAVP